MINKTFKTIHNKYSKFFKFFFFLRYVFSVFLIAIFLFFSIPKFFNYEKQEEIIKDYLLNYYDLELNGYSSINFQIFPFPNLSIENANLKIEDMSETLKSKKLDIFLDIKNIYNLKDFKARKILFVDNEISIDVNKTKNLLNYFNKIKYKLNVKNLNINISRKDSFLIAVKNLNISNYGNRKHQVIGEIFDKKFKVLLKNDNKDLSLKIFKTGIKAKFKFAKSNSKDLIPGSSQINILKNLLKFDFILNKNQLEIIQSNFRNKDISISFNSLIKFNPFFEINSNINVDKIDRKIFTKLNLERILENKEIIEKLNSNSRINFNIKRFQNNLIKSHSSNLSLAYGRLTFLSKIFISGGEINCKGDSFLIEEYPRLNFDCKFDIDNIKKLSSKVSISKNFKKEKFNLDVVGSLNLLNKKINFKAITIDKTYNAKEEEIKYFKETFENILFEDDFFDIFKEDKIKQFIIEII